ncbi:MAG: aldo/keto reductase [Burkholderiaceae bacterium]
MKTVQLPSGIAVPVLGQGTWMMGDDPAARQEEIATLQFGLDQGLTLIDTAEMYGDGRSEELVSAAIQGRRDQVFLVSKVLPQNASKTGTIAACERSLSRLQTDRIDLYLLHWRGGVPLAETVAAFDALMRSGKIRHWGVSNFDLGDLRELMSLAPGKQVATNQLLYNLTRRGIEWDLAPWLRQHSVPVMAYSPVEQGRLAAHPALLRLAQSHGRTAAQLALAWVLDQDSVVAIPKCAQRKHLGENVQVLTQPLSDEERSALEHLFPAPTRATPLAVI